MSEKRKFHRYSCKIKSEFDYYEGNPDEIDLDISVPQKGTGLILDISCGGLFLVTDEKVSINMPIRIRFKTKKEPFNILGKIVRTGLLKNNPSEIAQRFAHFSVKGDSYIAIEFDEAIASLSEQEL
ncbi:MAG: PilZ domain-containing protein [bacterium]|nr:PilZ domain-containing protein [bacterium]